MNLLAWSDSPPRLVTGRSMDITNASNDPVPARRRMPADVLLVEDNFIIALDTEDMLRKLGVESVRVAASVSEALEFIAAKRPDFALLDVNLGDNKCFEIAGLLRGLGAPFAFATGYDDNDALLPEFADVTIVSKPYNADDLEKVLAIF
ncbi:response regulator [Hyphomicrobium sp. LHD-15]|uniref:response regulator n=1 Tax=Hyphomicrobium sp. LHD-15 TaxID=3072142 RepID=UPI00280F50DE|nr:response regulator [Hyphomicrobium sp. LHD-15]MDQ8700317.1 response regulator [Hyphomicrobium sp. LHD-15]